MASGKAPKSSTRDRRARSRILVVDDDERNLLALAEVLAGLAEVVTATSGREALRHLLNGDFAVILLDVFMPEMDGYETAQLIRERQQTARIPIIFLSAVNKETEHLMRGYAMGAVDYVFKPVDAVILQSKVRVFVDLYEMRVEVEEKRRREQLLLDANLRAETDKLTVERELRMAEQRQSAIIASLPIVLYLEPVGQERRRPSFVSDNLAKVTGYGLDDIERSEDFWESRIHPDDSARVLADLAQRDRDGGWSIHYRWRCADGRYLHLHDQAVLLKGKNGVPVEYAGSFFDLSDRRELENQLLQALKMDAIGQLTGGVAHDFNNLLASILGGLHLLKRRVDLNDRDLIIVEQMRHAAERGAELVKRMMAFARKQDLSPASVDPQGLCQSVSGLVAPTLGGRVRVDWDCVDAGSFLYVDKSQLELALVNLIINARDAMPGGGTIRVSVRDVEGDAGARLMELQVRDEGVGIPAEVVDRVTEPFFTTKEAGKGTGLGLSMVAGFVDQSGGSFKIESSAGVGTAIRILLPTTSEPPLKASASSGAVAKSIRGLRILLIDDDEAVRTVLGEQLRDLGARVSCFDAGDKAAAHVTKVADPYDVVLSDFAMPGLDGVETIASIRRSYPGIGAVLMTGYADEEVVSGLGEQTLLVRKPVDLDELLHSLGAQAACSANEI